MECINGYRKYMDIMKGEKLRFPCQFVNPLQGGGDKVWREGIVILALYKFHCIREHENGFRRIIIHSKTYRVVKPPNYM